MCSFLSPLCPISASTHRWLFKKSMNLCYFWTYFPSNMHSEWILPRHAFWYAFCSNICSGKSFSWIARLPSTAEGMRRGQRLDWHPFKLCSLLLLSGPSFHSCPTWTTVWSLFYLDSHPERGIYDLAHTADKHILTFDVSGSFGDRLQSGRLASKEPLRAAKSTYRRHSSTSHLHPFNVKWGRFHLQKRGPF